MVRNDLKRTITHALDEMKTEQGEAFSLDKVNLAELERRTGISRAKLRRLKDQGFTFKDHGRKGFKAKKTVLSGYEDAIDKFLANGVSNSSVIFERIKEEGYAGGQTTVKDYIASHKHLLPPKRQVVSSQGNRGRRYIDHCHAGLFEARGAVAHLEHYKAPRQGATVKGREVPLMLKRMIKIS